MQLRPRISVTLGLALFASLTMSEATFAQPQTQANFSQPGNPPGNEAAFPPPEVQGQFNPAARSNGLGNYQPQGPMSNQGMMPNQGMQNQGMMPFQGNNAFGNQNQQSQPAIKANPQQAAKVFQWFLNYDEVRRRAQMNPIEKQRADGLLARGFGLFMPGQDKLAAKQLLGGLVNRYQGAAQSMHNLSGLPETKQLQDLYTQYFDTAMQLFSDYLKVQDNVFAVDSSGQSIAKQLIQRKMALEALEHNCKDLDYRMRQTYGVAQYQY